MKIREISIGTPFWNSQLYIPMYLKHVFNLDYPKKYINLIFVDNGSTDTTPVLLNNFAKKHYTKYKSIQLLYVPHIEEKGKFIGHSNIVKADNAIMDNCKSDLVLIGSDCFPPKEGLLKLLHLIELGADIAGGITLVGGAQTKVGRKIIKGIPVLSAYRLNTRTEKFQSISVINVIKPWVSLLGEGLINQILEVGGIGTGFAWLRKRVIDKLRFKVNLRYGEDLFYCLLAHQLGFKIMIDTSLLYQHWHYVYKIQKVVDGIYFNVQGVRNKITGEIDSIFDKDKFKR